MEQAGASLLAGAIDTATFVNQSMSALESAHIQAAWLGRLRAGGTGTINAQDRAIGLAEADTQRQYLFKFATDMVTGKQSEAQIANRANMYGQRLVGTANEAWKLAQPIDELIDWVDVEDSAECNECEEKAENGPYTPETVPGAPGDCSTPCRHECRCFLRNSKGETSFYNPEEGELSARKANE